MARCVLNFAFEIVVAFFRIHHHQDPIANASEKPPPWVREVFSSQPCVRVERSPRKRFLSAIEAPSALCEIEAARVEHALNQMADDGFTF